eukprot:CAMPEP_0178444872 /NCGR_PEP_ID=MMETSP0689_2-20121128/39807_1 /TAXON_ID=160604 /ORGANISM="Amphidinium massartii, Strain CS-259" /LENGTH=79 /DNA_ID=CAMNT_0020069269 /DNA_START=124 /DNA_END=364 /DNA_ORIENTATION=+
MNQVMCTGVRYMVVRQVQLFQQWQQWQQLTKMIHRLIAEACPDKSNTLRAAMLSSQAEVAHCSSNNIAMIKGCAPLFPT